MAGITFLDFRVFGVNSATAILSYLLAVLALATRWGLLDSTVASVVATLCVNFFFLPPVGTWTIADPQNWIALVSISCDRGYCQPPFGAGKTAHPGGAFATARDGTALRAGTLPDADRSSTLAV